jgi:hypothetical protein
MLRALTPIKLNPMKKLYNLTIIALLLISGCTKEEVIKDPPPPEDPVAELEQLADKYLLAWNNKDLNTLDQITADDGEYYGSDPLEIMDKQGLMDMYELFFQDTTSSYLYTVDMRKIRLSPDGCSAIIMERITFPEWSPKMPMCQTSNLVKLNGSWIIDFICWGFIIKNDDVEVVNDIL